jgi:hypothetical protein
MFAILSKKETNETMPSKGRRTERLTVRNSTLGKNNVALSISRKAACACGGGCPACQAKLNLNISQPNDPAEIEADAIADKVMRIPVHEAKSHAITFNSPNAIYRKCTTCDDEEETIQRKALPSSSGIPSQIPAHVQHAISSGGRPLDRETRSFYESRFRYDFSGIRVHTDANAEQSAKAIKALAYTIGKNIVFGENQYRPESESGKALIAHELVHTIQQNGQINRQEDFDAGVSEPRDADVPIAGVPELSVLEASPPPELATPQRQNICGPDITSALGAVYSRVETYFRSKSWFEKRRSCMALDVDFPFAFVNPIMAWDTKELFLPNTSFLDSYFTASGCGSPRGAGCPTDPTRHLCETSGTCGNSVIVGGKCMLAGTANYVSVQRYHLLLFLH